MPNDNRTISQLDEATLGAGTTLGADSLIETSITAPTGVVSTTGKVSRKLTMQNLGELLNRFVLFNQLTTTAKSIVGAINELKEADGVKITETLEAGQTSLTFSDASITSTSLISVYAEVWYSSQAVSTGSVVLTFPEQVSDMDVTIIVK